MRGSWKGLFVVVASALAACGGAATPAGGPASPEAGRSELPEGASKLGHFTSADGMVRLVVDRTGEKAKIQLDGSNDVIELTSEEVRSRGELLGHAFIAPDGKRALFLSVHGGLIFVKDGKDELPLVFDGAAKPLGKATIAGAPPPPPPRPKSPSEIFAEQLSKVAVTTRFPQFKPEDAGNLAKVAEAYQLAKQDMFVHCAKYCGAWYAPYPVEGGKGGLGFVKEKELRQGPPTEEEKKAPLSKYNAWLRPEYEFGDWTHAAVKSSWLQIFQFEFRTMQENQPALVWHVDVKGRDVFVVTPDGSRYWDSAADNDGKPVFLEGVPKAESWPAPLSNNLIFFEHVEAMAKAGLVDQKLAAELDGIQGKWGECARKVFTGAQKELEQNLTGATHLYSASNRNNLVRRKYNERAMRECGAKRAEQIFVEILAKREKEQRALYEKNKAKILPFVR